MAEVVAVPPMVAPLVVRRWRADDFIKAFFGSNALIAIVVLALITIFLFREGFGFFDQNLRNIRLYRRAGLEFVDIMRTQAERHAALSRQLSDIRLQEVRAQPGEDAVEKFDRFASGFSDAAEALNGLVSETTEIAISLRESLLGRSSQTQSDGSYINN